LVLSQDANQKCIRCYLIDIIPCYVLCSTMSFFLQIVGKK
jgi:hypothetical protein